MFGKTDSSKERLVQSTDQKSFKITYEKLIVQDCFVRFTALTGTEEEVKNYVIVEVTCEGLVLFPECFYTFVN